MEWHWEHRNPWLCGLVAEQPTRSACTHGGAVRQSKVAVGAEDPRKVITTPAFRGRMPVCLPHHHAFPRPHVNFTHNEMFGFVKPMQPPSPPSSLPNQSQQASGCSAGNGSKLVHGSVLTHRSPTSEIGHQRCCPHTETSASTARYQSSRVSH